MAQLRVARHVVPPADRPLAHPSLAGWLRLASSGWYLKMTDTLSDADTMELVLADTTWYFSLLDWQRRRPARRQPVAWLRWRTEERRLAAEQAGLVARTLDERTSRPLGGRH